ncbi:MAG: flagellar basal body P-ring formation protein FlgA [Acidobacteria bacterium]|nr:flagellar basal body P-ring formation protein FlgA [Acidobacteriota bacterium]
MRTLLLLVTLSSLAAARTVELSDARLRAADLFPDADPHIDLGPAPAPGAHRRVTRPQLLRWARQAGVSEDGLPEELLLVRKLRRVPAAESAERIRDLLAEEFHLAPQDVTVELADEATLEVPAGDLEWARMGPPPQLGRPVSVRLRWRDSSGRSGVESLTATLQARAEALTADSELPAGAELDTESLTRRTIDLDRLDRRYLTQLELDEAQTLSRQLNPLEPLVEAQLARRPVVDRGAMVELVLHLGAVHLRAPARAEGSGSAGDLVPFRNLATSQRVLAEVVDSKTAEVRSR